MVRISYWSVCLSSVWQKNHFSLLFPLIISVMKLRPPDDNPGVNLPLKAGLAVAAAAGIAAGYFIFFRSPRDGGIPVCDLSPLQVVKSTMSSTAPASFLKMGRSTPSPLFRIRFPELAPVYIVQDGALARALLTEPATDKPRIYSMFDGMRRPAAPRPIPLRAPTRRVPSRRRRAGTTSGVHSIFTKQAGDDLKHARKGVMPAFRAVHLARMREVCLDFLAKWEEDELRPAIEAKQPVDICHAMLTMTVRAISRAAFEHDLGVDEAGRFLADLELCLDEFAQKQLAFPWRKAVAWALPGVREAHAAAERNMAMVQRILDNYRALPPGAAAPETVVSLIARNGAYRNDRERCADLLIMLIAGHETTAFSICWTLAELAKHPEEAASLRAALRASAEPHACAELSAVIRESLRLNPVAALGSSRELLREYPVPGTPYTIPKGAQLILPYQLIHRYEQRIERPDDFVPSRWAEPAAALSDAFLPFAAGARNCVGQGLAMAELHAVIAKLVATYNFELAAPPEPYYALTNKPFGTLLLVSRAA